MTGDNAKPAGGSFPEGKYAKGFPQLEPGEPFFLIRGRDVLAPPMVRHYARLLHELNELDQAAEVVEFAKRFEAWQDKHGSKVAD